MRMVCSLVNAEMEIEVGDGSSSASSQLMLPSPGATIPASSEAGRQPRFACPTLNFSKGGVRWLRFL